MNGIRTEIKRRRAMYRNQTKEIAIGTVKIGGDNPVAIQSMTNTKTEDVSATTEQILRLEAAGCDIIRCAVPTMEAAEALREIKKNIHIPLVADIHFDYRLAIAAIENGADKIRINPGNIGSQEKVRAVVDKAKEYKIPIRVGVNSGSLEKHLLEKYGGVTAEGIVESAMDKVHMIEDMGYDNLVVSIKSSDVLMCVKAHELIAGQCMYPLHVGITEAGTLYSETSNLRSDLESSCMRESAIRSASLLPGILWRRYALRSLFLRHSASERGASRSCPAPPAEERKSI